MSDRVEGWLRDPAWLAHRYDPASDRIEFVAVPRPIRAQIPFFTDEYLPAGLERRVADRRVAVSAAGAGGPMMFIFHSAFCCSTLLANALEQPGIAGALKEPVILNDLSGWRRRGAGGRDIAERLDHALRLLARPWAEGEAVIVKPSNVVNALAPAMMGLRSEARAVLLHAPLRTYLESIASKGLWGRLWVRELLWKLMRDGVADFGLGDEELFRLSDLQVAAIGWLAQHRLFAGMIERFGTARVRVLDSETLLDRTVDALETLGRLFGLADLTARAAEIAGGPVFSRNAKTGAEFGRAERRAVHEGPAAANADEIGKVEAWARVVAESAGVPVQLPARLI